MSIFKHKQQHWFCQVSKFGELGHKCVKNEFPYTIGTPWGATLKEKCDREILLKTGLTTESRDDPSHTNTKIIKIWSDVSVNKKAAHQTRSVSNCDEGRSVSKKLIHQWLSSSVSFKVSAVSQWQINPKIHSLCWLIAWDSRRRLITFLSGR